MPERKCEPAGWNILFIRSVQHEMGLAGFLFFRPAIGSPTNSLRNPSTRRGNVYPECGEYLVRKLSFLWCSIALAFAYAQVAAQAASAAHAGNPAPGAPAQQSATAQAALLPDGFAGWESAGAPRNTADPVQFDAPNAAALKEFGFVRGETAVYKRSGDTLNLRALRFNDASSAYGAYSFYRQSGWPKEDIGSGAASDHSRVIFWVGTTVVDANFSQIGPMSASELRELASHLPMPQGNRAVAPPVLAYLPRSSLDPQTTHYAVGPAGYAGGGGVLPPELVGFDLGAETATANYSLRSGPATLTIIDYPTPQMAAQNEGKIRSFLKAGNQPQQPWPKPLADSDQASLEVRRSGPLLAIVSGDAIPDEAHKLLAGVHYDADLISIPQPTESEVNKTGRLLLGIVTLVIIGSGAAILLGFFLGGGRALYRMARGKPASSVYDEEFISLDLTGAWLKSHPIAERSHPKG